MKFSNNAEWLYPEPIEIENFKWKHIDAEANSNFGLPCEKLHRKLSSQEGIADDTNSSFTPIIILFMGDEPTDKYHVAFEQLKSNSLFKRAVKVAVAIGYGGRVRGNALLCYAYATLSF